MISSVTTDLPATPADDPGDLVFAVRVSAEGRLRVVHVEGEMDLSARNLLLGACLAGHDDGVILDMTQLTFLDCSGYGALVAARQVLEQRGASLTVRNDSGQPARLLALFEPAA